MENKELLEIKDLIIEINKLSQSIYELNKEMLSFTDYDDDNYLSLLREHDRLFALKSQLELDYFYTTKFYFCDLLSLNFA